MPVAELLVANASPPNSYPSEHDPQTSHDWSFTSTTTTTKTTTTKTTNYDLHMFLLIIKHCFWGTILNTRCHHETFYAPLHFPSNTTIQVHYIKAHHSLNVQSSYLHISSNTFLKHSYIFWLRCMQNHAHTIASIWAHPHNTPKKQQKQDVEPASSVLHRLLTATTRSQLSGFFGVGGRHCFFTTLGTGQFPSNTTETAHDGQITLGAFEALRVPCSTWTKT